MSARIQTALSRFLSADTRRQINAVITVDWHNDYASNVEDRLRVRGENELADRMLAEIEESIACGPENFD